MKTTIKSEQKHIFDQYESKKYRCVQLHDVDNMRSTPLCISPLPCCYLPLWRDNIFFFYFITEDSTDTPPVGPEVHEPSSKKPRLSTSDLFSFLTDGQDVAMSKFLLLAASQYL